MKKHVADLQTGVSSDVEMIAAEITTRQQEEQAWAAGAASRAAAEVQANRRAAYQSEADPLFFEEQAGDTDTPAGTWAAKRAEIKQRFPK